MGAVEAAICSCPGHTCNIQSVDGGRGSRGEGCAGMCLFLYLNSISGELYANQNSVNHSSSWKMPAMGHF